MKKYILLFIGCILLGSCANQEDVSTQTGTQTISSGVTHPTEAEMTTISWAIQEKNITSTSVSTPVIGISGDDTRQPVVPTDF